jgi:hypothetical protein
VLRLRDLHRAINRAGHTGIPGGCPHLIKNLQVVRPSVDRLTGNRLCPELERVQLPGTLTTLPGDQGTCPPEGSSGPDVADENFQCLHLRLLVSHGIDWA